jgi:hypothetical protein
MLRPDPLYRLLCVWSILDRRQCVGVRSYAALLYVIVS